MLIRAVIMRFLLYATGLLGLIDQATASPTPIDVGRDAVAKADPTYPKDLTVFIENDLKGPSYKIEADNRCVKFDPPVYKNFRSYGIAEQVCYFMDTDACDGEVLLTADARDCRSFWGLSVDDHGVDNKALKIAAVYCGDRTRLDDLASESRDDTYAIQARTTDTVASGSGDVKGCTGENGSGSCESFNALHNCKAFGSGFSHNLHYVLQSKTLVLPKSK